ncbi:DUF6511 domain-containing protein [Chelatococcus reniformis]|uniref:Uncharacterized protein n=1 Tax=Chelatococcus reniformis TaxID=1494448 RepID=A0A916UEV0_9HYPH|nr:DUF6511 domain-containing protein [Chelatococcus reniformis]GGC68423.1 hypothetical protein GCM10010994_28750 [Chelatococcus reniformis]
MSGLDPDLVRRFWTREPVICAICRRSATGLGYMPRHGAPGIWLCETDAPHGRKVYFMPKAELDAFEARAAREALDVAGPFLDEVGETRLDYLTPEQIDEFLRRLLLGYEDALRRMVLSHEPPF